MDSGKAMKPILRVLNPFYWLPRQVGLWLYIAFWLLVYVATQYRAEIKVRQLYQLRRQLSEKRAQYLQLNASVSQRRSYSSLKPALDSLGLELPKEAPIIVPIYE
ncbi:MAG: FtsL-like putative cell division protein [Bacteroidia bacterium]|nr:FtsL-like putative cell division protein [Bacteroidia bacterium]MCX7652207.1 FtsL-like putative cell division protein [Bacteroidia bacterium]MDW8416469.1 FtsL-like putative cell division protein [Bacteroidia bacterium]